MTPAQHAEAREIVNRLMTLLTDSPVVPPPPPPPPPALRVAFSNFGLGDSYNTSSARRITDPGSVFGVNSAEYAARFTVTEPGALDRIELPVSRLSKGIVSPRVFSLWWGQHDLPAHEIEAWEIVPGGAEGLVTLESALAPELEAGEYWLAGETNPAGSALDAWWLSAADTCRGVLYRKRRAENWQLLAGSVPAFRVFVA